MNIHLPSPGEQPRSSATGQSEGHSILLTRNWEQEPIFRATNFPHLSLSRDHRETADPCIGQPALDAQGGQRTHSPMSTGRATCFHMQLGRDLCLEINHRRSF